MPITTDDLANWFTYHAPTEVQVIQYARLRDAAHEFARIILDTTPPSADQTTAIRKIREAVFTANAAIACGGK